MSRKNKIIFLLVLLLVAAVAPLIVTDDYNRGVFTIVLINVITVLGLNFITGLTGQMNLGTAGIMAIGAYTSALLTVKLNFSPWITLVVSAGMGLMIGFGLGYPSLRVQGVYLALTTIGFSEVVRMLLSNFQWTNGIRGVHGIPALSLPGIDGQDPLIRYYIYLVFVVLATIIAFRISDSKYGRLFKAIRDNYEAVQSCGVNIAYPKIMAFTLAAVYGCVAGSLYALHMGFISPTIYTFDYSTTFVVMMILGGIGSVPGCVLGAVICTILPEKLRFLGNWYWIVFSIIILLIILFRPYGIVSLFNRKKNMAEAEKGK